MTDIAKQRPDGDLACLLEVIPPDDHQAVLDGVRELAADFEASVAWRFLPYANFPCRWSAIHHPGVGADGRRRLLTTFFDEYQECCRNRECDAKIFAIFQGMPDRVSRILSDKDFIDMIKARDMSHTFTNCAMERLLAGIRKWCVKEGQSAERVCASGFLGQLLVAHKKANGVDPCVTSRKMLLEGGVPIRAKKEGKRKGRPAGPFVKWLQTQRRPPGMDTGQYKDWVRRKASEWRDLPRNQKDLASQEAVCAHLRKSTDDSLCPTAAPWLWL